MMQHSMDPYKTPAGQPAPHPQPCPCGCAPCEEPCCGLECVERPRFYCGQLLGEDDLTALVDWTRARLRRARHLHGWGVVCGLNVHCDPKNPTGVIVSEGYAVDCCGEDVVLCADYPFDLADACKDEACLDPWRQTQAAGDRKNEYDRQDRLDNPLGGAAAVDLYLYYNEQHTHPEATLGQCGCGGETGCEFSRTRESYRLAWRAVDPQAADPRDEEFKRWREAYDRRLEPLFQFIKEISDSYSYNREAPEWDKLRARLRRWIKLNPLHHFCFIEEWLAGGDEISAEQLSRLLFWVALDYQMSWLHCECACCDAESGIPLARIWLQAPDFRKDQKCRVLFINDLPPHRRLIRLDDCLPSPEDCRNKGWYLWQRREEVEADYNVTFSFAQPPQHEELVAWLRQEWASNLLCDPRDQLRLSLFDTGNFQGQRVVGFGAATQTT